MMLRMRRNARSAAGDAGAAATAFARYTAPVAASRRRIVALSPGLADSRYTRTNHAAWPERSANGSAALLMRASYLNVMDKG
jgi:hypothetical protein